MLLANYVEEGSGVESNDVQETTVRPSFLISPYRLTPQKVRANHNSTLTHTPTLTTIPEEIVKQIIENLDNISSACLSVTARKFYRIHNEVHVHGIHGKYSLDMCIHSNSGFYYDCRSELAIRLNTWMETRGYIWISEAVVRPHITNRREEH